MTINIFDKQVLAQEKIDLINNLSEQDLHKVKEGTILRIIRETIGDRDRHYIKSERRAGNHWDSTIEFIYEHNEHAYLCLYVQNSSTDSSTCVSFNEFVRNNTYNGYCEAIGTKFTYDYHDIADVLRCILLDYVYYSQVEKEEREKRELVKKVLHYSIINPVINHFYNKLGPRHICLDWNKTNRVKYDNGQKAIQEYAKEHVSELFGKTKEELQAIYTQVFQEAGDKV